MSANKDQEVEVQKSKCLFEVDWEASCSISITIWQDSTGVLADPWGYT